MMKYRKILCINCYWCKTKINQDKIWCKQKKFTLTSIKEGKLFTPYDYECLNFSYMGDEENVIC